MRTTIIAAAVAAFLLAGPATADDQFWANMESASPGSSSSNPPYIFGRKCGSSCLRGVPSANRVVMGVPAFIEGAIAAWRTNAQVLQNARQYGYFSTNRRNQIYQNIGSKPPAGIGGGGGGSGIISGSSNVNNCSNCSSSSGGGGGGGSFANDYK